MYISALIFLHIVSLQLYFFNKPNTVSLLILNYQKKWYAIIGSFTQRNLEAVYP